MDCTKNQRIKRLFETLKASRVIYNQQDFVNRLSSDKATISQVLNGKIGVTSTLLEAIASAFPNVSRDWLLTGEGEMLKSDKEELPQDVAGASETGGSRVHLVPVVPVSAMADPLTGFDCEGVMRRDCDMIASPISNADLAIPMDGESMLPEYTPGSILLLKRIVNFEYIPWGRAYVLDTPNGIITKILQPSEKEGYVHCVSLNPDQRRYAPFDVPLSEVRRLFVVLMSMTRRG